MKLLFLTDLHCHNYKSFDKDGSRLKGTTDVIRLTFAYAHKQGIRAILFGGDLFDSQRVLPTVVVDEVVKAFADCKRDYPGIVWYCISGNHDYATKNTPDKPGVTAINFLAVAFPDTVKLIDNGAATFVNSGTAEGKGELIRVFGIPYYEHKEDFISQLSGLAKYGLEDDPTEVNLLMVHQTPEHDNTLIAFDIKKSDPLLEPFDLILCGHIHEKEWLTDKFMLGGNPIHRNLNDVGHDKGMYVIDAGYLLTKPAKECVKFISLNKQFPTIIVKKEGDKLLPEEEGQYIQWMPEPLIMTHDEELVAENFSADLTAKTLMENYWQEQTGGDDKELLEVGLNFLGK